MRKDKGLSGDADRLPMLTWIMFLKFLDDNERGREDEALLTGETFRAVIDAPYRWRDWTSAKSGPTGDDLMEFISSQEARRPDGTKGLGLFPYLRGFLGNENPRRAVVGNIFRGMQNRMADGYLLRNVVDLVDGIHFDSSDEIHTLGHLYESMLREMRDAAGDAGEFYTPRPVVRLMVEVVNPRLGETVYDPATGTGGFLVEAYKHLEAQARTVEDHDILQHRSIIGGEAKPLSYLLGQMNLLLHGLDSPNITLDNSLKVRLGEIGAKDRVSVILTNPPFGGEEESSIQNNFPADKRTSETALLFLQLIMKKLKHGPDHPGRAGLVVPAGTLFGEGVAAKIKEDLLKEFNVHTIVRLPEGTFAPYTDIPTNLVFFDHAGPTKEIWYYEQPLPEGRKKYTKTQPLQYDEFAPLLAWWDVREENERAWKVNWTEIYEQAWAEATPHWEAARQAETEARRYATEVKDLAGQMQVLQRSLQGGLYAETERLQAQQEGEGLILRREEAQGAERRQRELAKELQASGDAIYWPIYNLDKKNPSQPGALEHLSPDQIMHAILDNEYRITLLMNEIAGLLLEASHV